MYDVLHEDAKCRVTLIGSGTGFSLQTTEGTAPGIRIQNQEKNVQRTKNRRHRIQDTGQKKGS